MWTSSWSLVSNPDTPSSSSVQHFTPTPSKDSYFVAVADREYDALENSVLSGYDSASYLSSGDERLAREHPEEKEGSSSASAPDFHQGAFILETASLAQHQNEFAAQVRRVDEWLDNQPDQDYKAVDFAIATPVTPVASDAGDYEERGSLPYDEAEDADSESSSVSEAISEVLASGRVATGREGLDGGVENAMVEETYQVAEMEDAGLQISTAEVDSVVVKANTTENAAPEEDQSHIQAEKYFEHQDAEVEDNSPEVFGHEEISVAADPTSSEQLDPSILTTTSQQSHVTKILRETFLIPSPNPTAIPDHHKTTIIGAPIPAPPLILATRAHRSWLTILTTRRLPRE